MSSGYEPLAHTIVGDGDPLLFLHGLTFSRHSWDPILARLREQFTCIALDLPGHGESSGSGADLPAMVERIGRTVQDLTDQPATVIGHSAGALYATVYAAGAPVRGVVNIDQSLSVAGFAEVLRRVAPALRGPDFAAAFAPFEASIGVADLPEPERSRVQATRTVRQEVVLDHWHTPMSESPEDLQQRIDGLLDRIRSPYLWLASRATETDAEHLLAHVDQAVIERWPDAGHVLHLADARRFCDRVEQFATECLHTDLHSSPDAETPSPQ